jgi:hypothetical protein
VAAPAATTVMRAPFTRTHTPDLDRMVQLATANAGEPIEFNGWRIIFTGWKSIPDRVEQVHQWFGAPIKPFGIFEWNPGLVFVSSMPGYAYLMPRGNVVNLDGRWNQLAYGADLLIGANWDRAVRVSGWLLLEGIKGAFDFSACDKCDSGVPGHGHPNGYTVKELDAMGPYERNWHAINDEKTYTNQWDFSKLPPPLHFYADPDGFFLQQGLTFAEACASGFAEHCKKTLYEGV